MPVTCSDLLRLKSFRRIRLVAGQRGLFRKLSWPYVCFTPTISQWLYGGELIFVVDSGLQADEQNLILFMRECIEQSMAGMVILVGGESSLQITPAIKEIAEEGNFPLFEMPWDLKMIDVTQEIAEMIFSRREAASKTEHFLEQAYFTPDEPDKLEKLSALCGVRLRACVFTCILQPETSLSPEAGDMDLFSRLSYAIGMREPIAHTELLYMKYLSNVLICAMADTQEAANRLSERLTEIFGLLERDSPGRRLSLAFSRVGATGAPLAASYNEARKTLDIMTSVSKNRSVMHYQELGVLRLFYELPREELRSYCLENLLKLIEADRDNGSSLIATLRAYQQNDCNLVATARELFIHRNTLIYRLGVIRRLLGKEINDPFVKNELFNSLLLLDLLGDED